MGSCLRKFSLHDLCDRLPEAQRVSILLSYCFVVFFMVIAQTVRRVCRSVWPRGLKRTYAAAWSLGLRVRIPLRASMFVFCEYCLLSGRGLCDGLIACAEEPCCVCVSNCVIYKPQQWGGVGLILVVAPQKKKWMLRESVVHRLEWTRKRSVIF